MWIEKVKCPRCKRVFFSECLLCLHLESHDENEPQ